MAAVAVYRRVGDSWMRRAWATNSAEGWLHARRVPSQVRRVGDETPAGGELVVEFDVAAKAAQRRPRW